MLIKLIIVSYYILNQVFTINTEDQRKISL
jgi:hypothetical protein